MTAAHDNQLNLLTRTPSTIVSIELDSCARRHGTAPCAAMGTPCFNTLKTCRYRAAYLPEPAPLLFCLNSTPLPLPGEIVRPYLISATELAQEIRLDESLLINSSTTLDFMDEPDSDFGIDPYRVSPTLRQSPGGSQTIATAGTFWKKLRARNPHYQKRRVRVLDGFIANGFTLDDYKVRFTGVLDNMQYSADGTVKITAKGLLQLTDIEWPIKTDGKIFAGLSSAATTLELVAWSGVDRYAAVPVTLYAASGTLLVDDEVIGYTAVALDAATGITTFSGLTRGLHNDIGYGFASNHDANVDVQQCHYLSGNPIDLIHQMLNLSGIADSEINIAALEAERDTWHLGKLFRAVLFKPEKIKKYLNELREQTGTFVWQDDDQLITIGSVTARLPGASYRRITDSANIIGSSHSVDDNEVGRITRAVIWYDNLANTTPDSYEKFRRAAVAVDADAESVIEFDGQADNPPIFSRWLHAIDGGGAIAEDLAARIVTRWRNGAKTITHDIDRKDESLRLGEVYEIESAALPDFNGNPKVFRYIATKKVHRGSKITVTAYDTQLIGRPAFIAPDTVSSDYLTASDADKEYCYISDGDPPSPGNGDEPYLIN